MIYAFDEFELDAPRNVLRRGKSELRIEPRVLELLKHLVAQHARVVSKDELLGVVWRGEAVSEAVLPVTVGKLRRALGQQRGERVPIDTDHGVGYRFAAPVRVIARSDAHLAPDDSALSSHPVPIDPFVGREVVVQKLWSALQQAQAGRAQLVLVTGEAGIGKTRLVQELVTIAQRQGTRCWTTRCLEHEGAPAFWPWLAVLRQAVSELSSNGNRALGSRVLERLAVLLPELADMLDAPPAAPVPHTQEAKLLLFESIAELLRQACASRTHVLVLDDLHWADAASIELLQYLSSQLGASRLLILGTLRSDALMDGVDGAGPLGSHLLVRSRGFERVDLRPLSRDEVGRYVAALADEEPSESLLDALHAKTGGNPFFVREIVRMMTQDGGALPRTSSVTVPLPEQVRDVIRTRLRALGADSYRLLSFAAVIGSRFDLPLVERVFGLGSERLLVALDAAIDARLIAAEERDSVTYRFTHELFRETLYADLSVAERVKHHGAIAEALEAASLGRDLLERLSEMSLHFHRALPGGHARKACAYALEAAAMAMRSIAFEQAAMLYARALEADDYAQSDGRQPDLVQRCEILLQLSTAHVAAFRFSEAFEAADRAIEAARYSGEPMLFARAVLRRPQALMGMERGQRPIVEAALTALPAHETDLRARLLCCIARMSGEDDDGRREALHKAKALVGPASDPPTRLDVLASELLIPRTPREMNGLLEVAEELQRAAMRARRPDLAFLARRGTWIAELRRGNPAAAEVAIECASNTFDSYPHPLLRWHMSLAKLQQALMQGRLTEVETGWSVLLPDARKQDGIAALMSALVLHMLLRERGFTESPDPSELRQARPADLRGELASLALHLPLDRTRAQAMIRGGYTLARRAIDHPAMRAASAMFLFELGEITHARQQLELLEEHNDAQRDAQRSVVELSFVSQLVTGLGDVERARPLFERLEPHAALHVCDELGFYHGSVAFTLAGLARVLGRTDAAIEYAGQAIALHEALGARPSLLRSRLLLSELWLEEPSDRAKRHAIAQLEQIAADASALGMEGLAKRARAVSRIGRGKN